MVLLNLKPACLHMSIKFGENRSVIVSTLLLFSAVFSLFFVSILSKSRLNSYFALSSQTNLIVFQSTFFCVLALMQMKGNNGPIGGVPDR